MKALRQTDVMMGLFDCAHEVFCVAQKAFACRSQLGTIAAALKQSCAEHRLKRGNARTDSGLRDVQAARRRDKVTAGRDHEKGTGEFGIHYLSIFSILNTKNYRWID